MPRPLLMIPGPIDVTDEVMAALAVPPISHFGSEFIGIFSQALKDMRTVFQVGDAYQPFVVAGSGTLAMDSAAANLIEPGDRVLVLDTGYFGRRMVDICQRYGGDVDVLVAEPGEIISAEQVAAQLQLADYAVVAATHVDTSTGVLMDVQGIAAVAKQAGALTIVDGVCATAAEEMRQEAWGVDLYLTASQKAIGVPPGLALWVVSPDGLAKWRDRSTTVGSYYSDWGLWLPVMEAYEDLRPSYFATPAVNLVTALATSLQQILAEGMEDVFARHRMISEAVKAGVSAMGMGQVPTGVDHAAHTLTCPRFPAGVDGSMLGHVRENGAFLAGGLHHTIKSEYFRIGHMGKVRSNEILATLGALEKGLRQSGYAVEPGIGLAAAQAVLAGN